MRKLIFLALVLLVSGRFVCAAALITINRATIDYSSNQVPFSGSGFEPTKKSPIVRFAGTPLTVISYSDTQIVAALPANTVARDFTILIMNSLGLFLPYEPQGPQGEPGTVGPAGPTAPQGLQGPQGPAGVGLTMTPDYLSTVENGVTVTGPFVNSNVPQAIEFDIAVAAGTPSICSAVGTLAYLRTNGTGTTTSVNEVVDLLVNQPSAETGNTTPGLAEYFGPDDKWQNATFTPTRFISCSSSLTGASTTPVSGGWDISQNKAS